MTHRSPHQPLRRPHRASKSWSRPGGMRWRLFAVAQGLAALVVVLGFVLGVPALMLALGSDPLSARIPSPDRLRALLSGPDDGTLLVGAAQIVVWCAWAYSTLCLLTQTSAALAGRTVPVLRGVAGVRQPVSYLVTWITAAVTVPAASTTAATAAHAAVHATATPTPSSDRPAVLGVPSGQQTSDLPATASPAPPGPPGASGLTGITGWTNPHSASPDSAGGVPAAGASSHGRRVPPTVTVGRYDSLWRIAEEHLGDGRRWVEIYRLNADRPQTDGNRLTDPNIILEGWTLLLPGDAATNLNGSDRGGGGGGTADPAGQDGPPGLVVTVRPGDTLSALAERYLGTADASSALYRANTGRPQPGGRRLTDPDLLLPGWRLTLPEHAAHRQHPPAQPPAPTVPPQPTPKAPSTVPHTPAPTPRTTASPTTPPPTTAPSASSPASGPSSPGSVPGSAERTGTSPARTTASTQSSAAGSTAPPRTAPAPATTPPTAAATPGGQQDDRGADSWIRLPSGSILGLGLAATIAGLLTLVRRRRRQHRIPGDPSAPEPTRPALPAAAEAAEAAWLATRRRAQDAEDFHSDGLEPDNLDSDGLDLDDLDSDDLDSDDLIPEDLAPEDRELSLAGGWQAGAADLDTGEDLFSGGGAVPGAVTAVERGATAGGAPAPSLLALVGPPSAAVLADAAWSDGVGLTGPGAAGAARAVLARLLTASGPMGGQLLTTDAAVADLLPAGAAEGFSVIPGVTVFATLAAALTAAEAELLGRSRRLDDGGVDTLAGYRQLPDGEPVPAVLLLAHVPDTPGLAARARAVLHLGRDRELGAVWLGDWPSATLTVTATGALITDAAGPAASKAPDNASSPARPSPAAVGQAENLTQADAADLFVGLLPAIRDALDILDPTNPNPNPDLDPGTDSAGTLDTDETADTNEPAVAGDGIEATTPPAAENRHDTGDAGEEATRAPRRSAHGAVPDGALPAGAPVDRAVFDVAVFGRVRVTAAVGGREVTGLRAKVRDLLALLAVHPDGLTADQVVEALWPDAAPGRASRRLSPLLALTRRVMRDAAHLEQPAQDDSHSNGARSNDAQSNAARSSGGGPSGSVDLIPLVDGRYRLHPVLIDTEHRRFTAALTAAADARRDGDEAARRAALQAVGDLYRGEPLDGVTYTWAEPVRETLRRQATDALAALAYLLAPAGEPGAGPAGQSPAPADPAEALAALERAVEVDPYNEDLYRRVMRLQAVAGRRDGVRRTLRLLEARLVDLDTDPEPATLVLAADLLRSRSTRRASTGGSRRRD